MIKLVKWDTINLGYKVGSHNIEHINAFDLISLRKKAIEEEYDVIYITAEQRIPQLENLNVFSDEKIVYTQSIENKITSYNSAKEIKSYKGENINKELINLALESGTYSRYKLDPKFPNNVYEKLYKDWIINSITGDFAKDVLVYYDNEKIVGLLTYNIENNTSNIGIIAVDSLCRGKNIGTYLINYYKYLLPSYVKRINVVTQGINMQAKRFYEKNGYYIGKISYVYHYWIK